MSGFEEQINYKFSNENLLKNALTHCSYAVEHGLKNNQRLEFLGDAVLELCISKYIFDRFPNLNEGRLTRMRAAVVSEEPLSMAAEKLGLSEYVLLGVGERASGGAHKASVLSDTLEAVFAAVFLDGGFIKANEVILYALEGEIDSALNESNDYKTTLQEELFKNGTVSVRYQLDEQSGPAHNMSFVVSVYCNDVRLGTGSGTSKKRAEQNAAKQALAAIK